MSLCMQFFLSRKYHEHFRVALGCDFPACGVFHCAFFVEQFGGRALILVFSFVFIKI